ncbi:MAG TPA: ParB/RepB/Spo0J family partition protein [Clostridia bacterium]|nr:ParB/RepB/Spo0J family partition protein [Clostridia bacterium]
MSKRGLGKGLDALFQNYENPDVNNEELKEQILKLKIHEIDPNKGQPRTNFEIQSIHELSKSILEHGVVQPIIVKPHENRYTIVAGERRWRAARAAGLNEIPAIVRELNDVQVLEIALIENLQREDLNPMEESQGINNLIKSYGLTQEQVAQRLGKSRPAISNSLRLMNLPSKVRALVEANKLTAGHARALLGLDKDEKMVEIAQIIVEKRLSVRESERLIKRIKDNKDGVKETKSKEKPSFIIELEGRMEESLGTKVSIQQGKKKGIIEIEYYSNDDLDRIIEMISL